MIALADVDFGHHDHHTLRHLTSLCGDFESLHNKPGSLEDLKRNIDQQTLDSCVRQCDKCQRLSCSRWSGGDLSAAAVISVYRILGIFEKIRIKINNLQ